MSFQSTWSAIRALMLKTWLQTINARAIMRKSGFRPGVGSEAGGVAETPVLSVCPTRSGRVCPRPPYGEFTFSMTVVQRTAFYAVVKRAAAGEPAALLEIHDILVEEGYPPEGAPAEPYTLTLEEGASCPIEVDIDPTVEPFVVLAVRMSGEGPPLPSGTHSYPVKPSVYS